MLSTPPAFILSQDQTLIKNLIDSSFILVLLLRNVLICLLKRLNESTGFMVTILFSKFIYHLPQKTFSFYTSHCHMSSVFLFLFYFLVKQSGEGGIRTLAPVNPTYTLSRGTSSANLSTSPNKTIFIYVLSLGQDISYQTLFLMSSIFN